MSTLQELKAIEAALTQALSQGKRSELVTLYHKAAHIKFDNHESDAGFFLLTIAYVYGLETDHHLTKAIHQQLCQAQREE